MRFMRNPMNTGLSKDGTAIAFESHCRPAENLAEMIRESERRRSITKGK